MRTSIIAKLFFGLIFSTMIYSVLRAQNTFPSSGPAGIGTTTPNAAALLDMESTTKGLLIPRLTLGQRNAIAAPVIGLLIFQTTNTPGFYYYNGTTWTAVSIKSANLTLSNLTTTALGVDLLPAADNTINAGSAALKYKNVNLYDLDFSDGTIQTTAFKPYTAGRGISVSGTTIINGAPDQVVTLTPGAGINIAGTYPGFTISSTSIGSQWTISGSNVVYSTGDAVINNVTVGKGGGTVSSNSVLGNTALSSNSTGSYNTAIGSKVLYSNTTGNNNTGNGEESLYFNTTGFDNTANGEGALLNNSIGNNNTANGQQSLLTNTTGNNNTAIGQQSLVNNTTGNNNTADGIYTLKDNTTGYSNVALGVSALYANTTASNIVAIGDSALYNNTGIQNTATGSKALYNNTTGNYNTAIGSTALISNTIGNSNTATGNRSMISNINGSQNTAYGEDALLANISGGYNTATGEGSMQANTTGSYNTATGLQALWSNTTGRNNTANGSQSLIFNTTGSYNTVTGAESMFNNTTGYSDVAFGEKALYFNNTGSNLVAIGDSALYTNTTGNYNTGVGINSLFEDTAKSFNTALGWSAGAFFSSSASTFVGHKASSTVNGVDNSMALGYLSSVSASNQVRIGNSSVTSIGGFAGWSNVSDGRVKTNIKMNVPGLAFINKLQPITYNLNLDAIDKIMQPAIAKDKKGNIVAPSQEEMVARTAKEQVVYTGFIAQDVETAAKSLNYDFSGVDAAKNSKDLYGLRYSDFVVPIVKGMQELSSQNDSLKETVVSLQSQIDELKNMVLILANKDAIALPTNSTTVSSASLQQNVPNPYSNSTSIAYTLPQTFSSAQIIITDNTGKTLKSVNISGAGTGVLNVDASTLAAGVYQYSLLIDGKLIDTKKMVLAK